MSALLRSYKYSISEGRYYFETESGIKYFAYFLDLSEYGPNLYTFSFEKVEPTGIEGTRKAAPGKDVLDTICQILSDFFQKKANAMLFVCDSTDGRAEGDSSGLNVPPVAVSNVPGISESNVPPCGRNK